MADLLVKNGRVLDPGAQRDGRLDVLIRDGIVAAIGPDLASAEAKIIDAKNLLVLPGLIDVHLHLMDGLGAFGADPDVFGVGSGVTTVVDAGSTGHSLFPIFRRHIAEPAKTRVLAYVNLSTLGSVAGPGYSTLEDPRLIDEAKIEAAVEKNREMIVGIKVMATGAALGKAAPARAAAGGQSAFAAAGAHRGELEQYRRDPAGRECARASQARRHRDAHVHYPPGRPPRSKRQVMARGRRSARRGRALRRRPRSPQSQFRRRAARARSGTQARRRLDRRPPRQPRGAGVRSADDDGEAPGARVFSAGRCPDGDDERRVAARPRR